jgi:hypothetical protein
MALRDWFAGQALAPIMAAWGDRNKDYPLPAQLAGDAYRYADAMLAERDKS